MGKYEPMKNAGKKFAFDAIPTPKQKDRSRTAAAKKQDVVDTYRRHSKELARNGT